jgi:hypothetical protein
MDKIPDPKMRTKKFIFCRCKFQGGNPPSPPVAIGDHNKKTTNVFFSLHCCCHCCEEFESLFADDDGVSDFCICDGVLSSVKNGFGGRMQLWSLRDNMGT